MQKRAAHRIADHGHPFRIEPATRLLKRHADSLCQPPGNLVQKSGIGIRLVEKDAGARKADLGHSTMREEDRRADKAARADDNLGPVAQEDERPLDDPDREHAGKSQQGHKGTRAREGPGTHKADGVPLLGHDPSIQLVSMAHVEEFGVCPRLPNFVGNGQGRVHVATRAAAGEQVLH